MPSILKFNPMRRQIPILKRLIPSIRKRHARVTWKDGRKVMRVGSAQFELYYTDYVDRQVAFYGDFEKVQLARLRSAIERYGCDLFVDIGANFGFYAVQLAAEAEAPAVRAYEPDPRSFERLQANIERNGLGAMTTARNCAVAARNGTLAIELADDTSTGQTKVVSSDRAAGLTVQAVSLDEDLDISDAVIFFKIDVEGFELEVLSGMTQTLAGNRCYMQIECFRENIPLLNAMMKDAGYRPDGQVDHDFFFTNID